MIGGCVMTLNQGHISKVKAHIPKIRVRARIVPYLYVGSGWYFTQLLYRTQRCVMTLNQGQCQSTHTQNLCPGKKSSVPCWSWILFHTIVVHDPKVCHDFKLRSYLQGQGHSAHIPQVCVQAITPYCHVGS